MLEAVRPVQVNDHSATRALLRGRPRDTRRDVPAAVPPAGARQRLRGLEMVSGHRWRAAVDGVLLMAETLIMGPGAQAHVTVPDLKDAGGVVPPPGRAGPALHAPLTVNGQRVADRCVLASPAQVSGEEISFALEPVGTRL